MNSVELSTTEQLCHASIDAGVKRLCEIGVWPRPPAARRLRAGYDFYYRDLESIQEANNLVQHLASDNEIKTTYFSQSSAPELWILYDYWMRLLLNILCETEGRLISKGVFCKWFKRFIKELYSDTAVWRTVDTVTGLIVCDGELRFDQATALTSIPAYNLRGALLGQERYFTEDWRPSGHDKATIITTVKVAKRQYAGLLDPPPHLLSSTERSLAVIEAVRLIKPGAPRLHCHAMAHLSNFPLSDPLAYCDREGKIGLYEREAILEKLDFRNVMHLWRELMNTKYADRLPRQSKLSAMDTALARFSNTYKLRNWLDRILDLTIALESLFGPRDNQELKHRIALRAAWLLSSDKKDDEDSEKATNRIYNSIRTMYDIRSCRAHGGIPKDNEIRKWVQTLSRVKYDDSKYWEILEVALESARDIVRKAIKACTALGRLGPDGPHWPLPKNFDENIVICGQRRVWQKAAGIKSKG